MLITGKIWKDGKDWLAESEIADVMTQGATRVDAGMMLADAIESLVDRKGFKVTVRYANNEGDVVIEANDPAALAALVLKRQRVAHGLSLADVAEKLGQSSKTSYARYEQGQVVPSLEKFQELLDAVAPEFGVTISRTRTPNPKGSTPKGRRSSSID
jgi:DNA-binding XRE family transcriptional regulator